MVRPRILLRPFRPNLLWDTLTSTLSDVDFSSLSVGTMTPADFTTATGLVLTRAAGSTTLQTSASTLVKAIPSGYARIGNRTSLTSRIGLVLEQSTRNWVTSQLGIGALRSASSGWAAGSGAVISASTGPDGTANNGRQTVTSGGYGPYLNLAVGANRFCWSAWERSQSTSQMQMGVNSGDPLTGNVALAAGSTVFQRLFIKNNGVARQYFGPVECRATGSSAAQARDVISDFAQTERGDFPTEVVDDASFYRKNDRLSITNGASVVGTDGRIRFYARLTPKFASTDSVLWEDSGGGTGTSANWFLWSFGGTGANRAVIDATTKRLKVTIGGVEVVSANALAWTLYQLLEISLEVGAGGASVAKYRVDSGAWNDLALPVVAGTPAPAGVMALFYNDAVAITADVGVPPAWLHRQTFYGPGGAPA